MTALQRSTAPPEVLGWIRAARSRDMKMAECLKELIDNSFDADATRVHVEFEGKRLTVRDDGCGCSDHMAMVQTGNHKNHRTTQLGMYGVGLKDVSAVIADRMVIESVEGENYVFVSVDWKDREKHAHWDYTHASNIVTDSIRKDAGLLGPTGTTIRFDPTRKRKPDAGHMRFILADLGFHFSPAIQAGRQIIIADGAKRHIAEAYGLPDMDNVITQTVDAGSGRQFHVTAGVLKPGVKNPGRGFIFAFGHRIIMTNSEACREYGGSRFYGYVHLTGRWRLSDHKSDIIEDRDELFDRLYDLCLPQLKAANEATRDVEIQALAEEVSSMLSDTLGSGTPNRKASRNPPASESGAVIPSGAGAKHRQARNKQTGKTFRDAMAGRRVQVRFDEGLDQISLIDVNRSRIIITCNLDHPWIRDVVKGDASQLLLTQFCAQQLAHWYATADEDERMTILPQIRSDRERDAYATALDEMLRRPAEDHKQSHQLMAIAQ